MKSLFPFSGLSRCRLARASVAALALAFLLGVVSRAPAAEDPVVISSTAGPDYVRPLDANGRPMPETYIFTEGKYMGGSTADASERKVTFTDITQLLAVSLSKQNYIPTRDTASAKILIRIFWGTTLVYEDPERERNIEAINSALSTMQQQAADGGLVDPGPMRAAQAAQELQANSVEGALARNAALLGYKRSLDKESQRMMASVEEQTMRMELAEDRYFVVLMAYDYQFMLKEKKPKLLWVTRLSMRGPGNNFLEAFPALTLAGAQVYGQNLTDMKRIKVSQLPSGNVKMGDIQVLGTVEGKGAEGK
ncbi:MAG TPA: hypothetical protein VHN79_07120 [Lacunisphaera sp.]|nr:hypothetical protein [Lacunisphaera sp.]HEX2899217.1 hypothetical protein [Bacteroidia bacterium]